MNNNTGGSGVIDSAGGIGLILHTPSDDYPFFSFSMTDQHVEEYQGNADWVCLFFAGPNFPLEAVEALLCKDRFPNDYGPSLPLDFMFLPVSVLRWQVEQTTSQLVSIKSQIIRGDEGLISRDTYDFADIRTNLFNMRRKHLMLHRRWMFAQEFAEILARCFRTIEKRCSSLEPVEYSASLAERVRTQKSILGTVLHDLETIPLRIDAQQTMIAKNSEAAIEESRRDSASMRTIAIVTLVFLPGTFVAAIFSTTFFNFQANNDKDGGSISGYSGSDL
ncbi:hypothetical protein FQN54_001003 [Arachnomyces sp. PD_36]|nr:hypothetical protein FQN54_001003 [Arachnomyces sp. PD_36]